MLISCGEDDQDGLHQTGMRRSSYTREQRSHSTVPTVIYCKAYCEARWQCQDGQMMGHSARKIVVLYMETTYLEIQSAIRFPPKVTKCGGVIRNERMSRAFPVNNTVWMVAI